MMFCSRYSKALLAAAGVMAGLWCCAPQAAPYKPTDDRTVLERLPVRPTDPVQRELRELRRAVEAAPADWDAKYDFELVTRLAAALRKSPKVPPNQLMQLLRPQQRPAAKSGRHIG